jgi:peroxiredoxin
MRPKLGNPAPDFSLKSHLDRPVHLGDYLGKKNVVLAFFPLAWTPV